MTDKELRRRLDAQGWACAYAHPDGGADIKPGDPVALAYDNYGLVHADCAAIGVAPNKE